MARTIAGPCAIEEARLDPIRPCLTNHFEPAPPEREWANASISLQAVAYSCGAIARRGDAIAHDHDPTELALCQRLSAEAAKVMAGVEVGMGSAGIDVHFAPFFVTASRGAQVPVRLSEEVIRTAFGGTICPNVAVVIEPLEERGEWWGLVLTDLFGDDEDVYEIEIQIESPGEPGRWQTVAPAEIRDRDPRQDEEDRAKAEAELERWRAMVRWFRSRAELHGCRFVRMQARARPRKGWVCCDFPYLALGITAAGSLVGIWGHYIDR